ncbi:hypothetical protein BKA65DRAFT_29867 [Rhexocercosporidium sp. MPI-PUGE-AT-0058]|nr:hypothetical protein BKA65DRAFT_29867 [Rhexocercosporidium sp. MPI-PUGE-AT-0058]
MSNIRQQKWDWSSHLPRMMELYNTQMSIPDIHKAIQCDRFEPCQRSVYLKFKQLGYPTDPVGRTKFLDAQLSSNLPAKVDLPSTWMEPLSPPFDANQFAGSTLHSPFHSSTFGEPTMPWGHGFDIGTPGSEHMFDTRDILGAAQFTPGQVLSDNGFGGTTEGVPISKSDLDPGMVFPSWLSNGNDFEPSSNTDHTYQYRDHSMELQGASYFGIDTDVDIASSVHEPASMHHLQALSPSSDCSKINAAQSRPMSPNPSLMDLDTGSLPFQFSAASSSSSNSVVKLPFQKLIGASNTGARNKIRSLFRPKSSPSIRGRKRYAVSQFTNSTEDSGYASGHASSLTLEEVRWINSQSLDEFNGLYRVACQVLHEPHSKALYKDIPTCNLCQYSGIHNLGWSARYLKLEVFLSELRLDVYNFGALDAAGNTALHYAAAGGASYQHLKALIDVGVDPYVANTAGELFIYCLRPIKPFTIEPNSDCLKSDDLIKLLGLLQLERVLDWRDNDGQTIMHALALKISEPELKTKIFNMLKYSRYSSTVLDRFGRSPEDVVPLTYDSHGQVIDPVPISSLQQIEEVAEDGENSEEAITCEAMIVAEFRLEGVKQIKANTIVVEARHQPRYVDIETGDNVFHALSRINSSSKTLFSVDYLKPNRSNQERPNRERNYILLNLEYFISKGVDLDLHNREGAHPLKSFICDRAWDESETGATMSKYLDMILWKDRQGRTRNKVNVNMKDREGYTALHHAAIRGRPDSVRSLIEAGANVNARSVNQMSILHATFNALDAAVKQTDKVLVHLLKEVISYLEHAGAVQDPTSLEERGAKKA